MLRTHVVSLGLVAVLAAAPALGQTAPPAGPVDGADSATDAVSAATQTTPPLLPAVRPPLVAADDRPITHLFQHLFRDLGRLPSRSTAMTLGIGALLAGASLPIDDHVSEHASAGGTDQIFHVGGMVGGGYVQAGGAIVTYIAGRVARSPRFSHLGADLIRAQALTGFVTHGVKLALRRPRPGEAPGHFPATYSFPSAHASGSWASATVLWRHAGWKAGVPAAVFATYVSGSRIQQRQHFLSDVAFGAAVGIAAARTVTFDHGGRQIIAGPVVVPGGAGVAFTVTQR